MQRIHVVSVYLHYSKIIWLPWQHPWQIGEWGTDPSSACKELSYGEIIAKIGPVHPEILGDIRRTTTWTRNAISIRMFSTETTGLIFTKILLDIVALVLLFNHAYTRGYPIPFLNARATKLWSLPFFCTKSVAMATSLQRSRSIIGT